MPIIASNFKTNHTRKSTSLFVEKLNEYLKSNEALDEIYIFPTSTSLDSFELNSKLFIGAQNAYPTKNGSFTGEIGLEQLEEFDIKTILIGHSERRHILGETQEEIAKKYDIAINNYEQAKSMVYYRSVKRFRIVSCKKIIKRRRESSGDF